MQINSNEIHIWSANLAMTPEQEKIKIALLSEDECERARQFRFQLDRQRYIASRSLLREILSTYLKIPPEEIVFGYTEKAKPFLHCKNQTPLEFNLSHSEDWAVYAITVSHAIGVDIEKVQNHYNKSVAKRFFSSQENNDLMQLAVEERALGFYRIWSRKEAVIKATGKGLSTPLSTFSVSVNNVPERIEFNHQEAWTLLPLSIHNGYQSAVATNQLVKRICYWLIFEQKAILDKVTEIPEFFNGT